MKSTMFEDLEEAMVRGMLPPPIYIHACEAMALALKAAIRAGGEAPQFCLGPAGVALLGPCIVPGLCKNNRARTIVDVWVSLGRAMAEAVPTVRMVEAVLIAERFPFERAATIEALGVESPS